MSATTVSLLAAGLVLVPALILGVNIGVALMIAGVLGSIVFTGSWFAGVTTPLLQTVDVASSYPLMVIPLFLLMGTLATQTGITVDLFRAFYLWIGRLPGGIAVATIGTCAGMAAITGSSVAVAGTMCKIALPELRRYGYRDDLSVGAISVGGTLAIMIPPSITFVLYAIFAEQSIGQLLIAGILPGLLLAFLYGLKIVIRCILVPSLGPPAPRATWSERLTALPLVLPFIGVVVAILGGMLIGLWTPVESAAIGVALVFLLGIVARRLSLAQTLEALLETVLSSASIFLVVVGSLVFGNFLALNGAAENLARWIGDLSLTPGTLFGMLMLFYFLLGCFMEITSILALTIPLVMPLVGAAGWNPIWFGVVVVTMMEVAAVTPPVGLNLYAVRSAAPDVPLRTIYAGAVPFWCINIAVVFLLYAFPQIALYLPSKM